MSFQADDHLNKALGLKARVLVEECSKCGGRGVDLLFDEKKCFHCYSKEHPGAKRSEKKQKKERTSQKKRKEPTATEEDVSPAKQRQKIDLEEIIKQGEDIIEVDSMEVRQLISNLISASKKNQMQRAKYSSEPKKFVDSEMGLLEAIQNVQVLAASSEFYPDFIRAKGIDHILSILAHENTDITMAAIKLLRELTDPTAMSNDKDVEADIIIQALVDHESFPMVVSNLSRMDESNDDDAVCVNDTIAIMENILEVKPTCAVKACQKTKILHFLLKRLRVRTFDDNKLYASEVLASLLQTDSVIQKLVGELRFGSKSSADTGILELLKVVAYFRKHDPASSEEAECVENAFDCICSCLLNPSCKDDFREKEGFVLMLRFLKANKFGRLSALKVIDFAINENAANCKEFLVQGGLKALFPMFMGKGCKSSKTKKCPYINSLTRKQVEEHVLTSIWSLCQHLQGSNLKRFLIKFLERDFEKLHRLVELCIRYHEIVERASVGDETMTDEELLLARLDSGLFTLQRICCIAGEVCVADVNLKKQFFEKLRQQNMTPTVLRDILIEYAEASAPTSTDEDEQKTKAQAFSDKIMGLAKVFHKEG